MSSFGGAENAGTCPLGALPRGGRYPFEADDPSTSDENPEKPCSLPVLRSSPNSIRVLPGFLVGSVTLMKVPLVGAIDDDVYVTPV